MVAQRLKFLVDISFQDRKDLQLCSKGVTGSKADIGLVYETLNSGVRRWDSAGMLDSDEVGGALPRVAEGSKLKTPTAHWQTLGRPVPVNYTIPTSSHP